jgi:hypothetical protein
MSSEDGSPGSLATARTAGPVGRSLRSRKVLDRAAVLPARTTNTVSHIPHSTVFSLARYSNRRILSLSKPPRHMPGLLLKEIVDLLKVVTNLVRSA